MTADEDYIYYDLKEENLDWVPLEKTIYLKNSRETETDLLEKIDKHLENISLDRQIQKIQVQKNHRILTSKISRLERMIQSTAKQK